MTAPPPIRLRASSPACVQHHHIAGPNLRFFAGEMAWREDNRRWDNRALYELAGVAALSHSKSRNRCGYW
jgi:hypothetical protein